MPETVPVASVVIPAHNEARSILRCLEPVLAVGRSLPLEVVVAANGCRDETVALATAQPGVTVLDLPVASKVAALNAADDVASAFPRVYLDADVRIDEEALRHMIEALQTELPRLAAPSVRYDTAGADRAVRRFYEVFTSLPSARSTTVGRGVYALSEAGRARFGRFPDVQGDDLFVNRLFTAEETIVSPGAITVRTPRRWRDLVRVRARLAAGNAELAAAGSERGGDLPGDADFSRTTGRTVRALARHLGSHPRHVVSVLVYVGITVLARTRRTGGGWQRDESTR